MEITPRPKTLTGAILVGLVGIGILIAAEPRPVGRHEYASESASN